MITIELKSIKWYRLLDQRYFTVFMMAGAFQIFKKLSRKQCLVLYNKKGQWNIIRYLDLMCRYMDDVKYCNVELYGVIIFV